MSDPFEHTDKAIYFYRGRSDAESCKIYEILDRKGEGCNTKFKIEPGWYSINSFSPYYDVKKGDTLICTRRYYCGRGNYLHPGDEVEIYSVNFEEGISPSQVIRVVADGWSDGRRAWHDSFKPAERTLREKVDLI